MKEVIEIPISKIKRGQHELRMAGDDEELDSLVGSIRRVGIIVPVTVVLEEDQYHLLAGHRRVKAAIKCGLEVVPAIVTDCDTAKRAEVSFAENIFRKDLSPVEIAAAVKDVLQKGVMDIGQVSDSLGRSRDWVGRMVAMLAWSDDVLGAIHDGWLSVSAGANLAMVTSDSYRKFLLDNARENGVTARTTAAWLQAWRSFQPPEDAVTAEPVPGQRTIQPAVPQAPCICCGEVYRTDELSHVPACCRCIKLIREIGQARG